MWNLRGRFDPVTGVRLAAKLEATVEAMFAEAVPDGCPDDPIEKQRVPHRSCADGVDRRHRRCRPSRARRVRGGHRRRRRPATTGRARSSSGRSPSRSPPGCSPISPVTPTWHAVVVRHGVVLHAPGELNLGRTTTAGEPGPTTSATWSVPWLCDPGLHHRLRPLQTPPHHLVATRRHHRSRQSDPGLLQTSHQDPPRRLDHRTRTPPRTHPATPRRHHPQHRPTPPTHRRLKRRIRPLVSSSVSIQKLVIPSQIGTSAIELSSVTSSS